MAITEERVRRIHDEKTLFEFLGQELGWPVAAEPDTYPFYADELGLTDDEAGQIKQIRQIAPFDKNQPWGVFLVEFHREKVYQGALRRVLRGLSETRRDRDASLPAWKAANLLFICTPDFRQFSFARFDGQTHTRATLSIFGWDAHDGGLRTLCEYNLPALRFPSTGVGADEWLAHWATAWNVERVTERFYDEYKEVFTQVEALITGVAGDKRLFTQRLFNRLMFIQFLSKKRWLRFGQDRGGMDYLRALWDGRDPSVSFYTAHLCPLFFAALNNPHIHRDLGTDSVLRSRIGQVPYLNGGLFQKSEDEGCGEGIPDAAFDLIINRLFSKFNFTVHESTPLDIEVAVDPEMLGKVFEELVTGRHESGSYYTPRPVVAFMCKEALKGYLGGYEALVDHHDAGGVNVPQARELLRRLAEVKVVDPACGSGAYLLGMLQELFALNRVLDTRAEQVSARDDYKRKLDIVRNNIYGVDLDDFAVQIARLRLWLSLAVEYDGEFPEPLPNLDFKVEQGDSLSAPDPQGGPTADIFRQKDIEEFSVKKAQYADPYYKGDKAALKREIKTLRDGIAAWAHPKETVQGFDWRVEFAEVFEPSEPVADLGGAMNFGGTLAEPLRPGGFDIVVMNPPYLSGNRVPADQREQFQATLKRLKPIYGFTSDLYVFFFYRAIQLLSKGGTLAAITSNTYLTNLTKRHLRQMLLSNRLQWLIPMSKDVFAADVYSSIIIAHKGKDDGDSVYFLNLRKSDYRAINDRHDWRTMATAIPASEYRRSFSNIFFEPTEKNRELFSTLLSAATSIQVQGQTFVPLELVAPALDTGIHSGNVRNKLFYREKPQNLEVHLLIQGTQVVKYGVWWANPAARFYYVDVNYRPDTDAKGIGRGGKPSAHPEYWHFCGPVDNHLVDERLLMRQTEDEPFVGYIRQGKQHVYTDNTLHTLLLTNMGRQLGLTYLYLMALLNSTSLRRIYHAVAQEEGRTLAQVKTNLVNRLPILVPTAEDRESLEALVSRIQHIYQRDGFPLPQQGTREVQEIEAEIDARVSKLYNL